MAAFDFVVDYEEWIECGYFNEEIRARLKGWYNIKEGLYRIIIIIIYFL